MQAIRISYITIHQQSITSIYIYILYIYIYLNRACVRQTSRIGYIISNILIYTFSTLVNNMLWFRFKVALRFV